MGVQTIVHLLRHGEVHNPAGVLYGRRDGFTSPTSATRWRSGSRSRSATATSSTCVRLRSSARKRPARRSPRRAGSRR